MQHDHIKILMYYSILKRGHKLFVKKIMLHNFTLFCCQPINHNVFLGSTTLFAFILMFFNQFNVFKVVHIFQFG